MDRHNEHYRTDTVDKIVADHENLTKNKVQYKEDNPIGMVVDNISPNVKIAVDIGSGQGWGSNYLSQKFEKVYAIEPSIPAMKAAKFLYGKASNIVWINGFAEEEIRKLNLESPALFYCACVLSHLEDSSVEEICASINSVAKSGSRFSFSENWGIHHFAHLWHSRSAEWWQKQFPGWELTFKNAPGAPSGVKKGIVGLKK